MKNRLMASYSKMVRESMRAYNEGFSIGRLVGIAIGMVGGFIIGILITLK
jgi:tetrahydromethanopterin S-methyltransferase subunit G